MLNATVLDVRTGKTPYEKVFRTQPITSVPKTKFVGNRVESVLETSVGQDEVALLPDQYITEEVVEHIHEDSMDAGAFNRLYWKGVEVMER